MPIKETYHEDKSKAKVFTGGKPKDFVFTGASKGGIVKGAYNTTTKTYSLTTSANFDAKDLHEFADTLKELAGLCDGTVTA